MNYLDYLIIGIVVFYGLWGISKGLLKIVFDFLGYIVAFFAAKLLSPTLVSYITTTGIKDQIFSKISETFTKINPDLSQLETLKLPDNMSSLLQQEPELTKVLSEYPQIKSVLEDNMAKLSGQGILDVLTEYVIFIASILVIFIVTKLIYSIIISIVLSQREELPLAITNRILGLTLGLGIAFILLSFAFQLAEVYAITSSPVIANAIRDSKFGYLFTSVPLVEWLSQIV